MMSNRDDLFEIMYKRSFKFQPDNPFTLVSGNISPLYFDCRATLLYSKGIGKAAAAFCTKMITLDKTPNLIGGLTMGADPITYGVTIFSPEKIEPVIIRKEAKAHGTKKQIEGTFEEGDTIVIVDDVITTGGSTIKAINAAREAGLEVEDVIVLVDREEFDGVANIEKEGVKVHSIFKAKEFIDRHLLDQGRTHRDDGTIIGGKYEGRQDHDVTGWKPE